VRNSARYLSVDWQLNKCFHASDRSPVNKLGSQSRLEIFLTGEKE
jgi:hypothetical protein